jgi:hypothetical protein
MLLYEYPYITYMVKEIHESIFYYNYCLSILKYNALI